VVQLNAYAYIGNRGEFNPATGIGLVYYEPATDIGANSIDRVIDPAGFRMAFASTLHPLPLDPDGMIPALLRRVREIVDEPTPPEQLGGCKDCELVDALLELAGH
jgi:hypothetical protein